MELTRDQQLDRILNALALELPGPVWEDAATRIKTLFKSRQEPPSPVRLQDGLAPEWTCPTCHQDALFCKCPPPPSECAACGRAYEEFGLDVLLRDSQWMEINGGKREGLLCAQCIVDRAALLPGVLGVHLFIEIATRVWQPIATAPNNNEWRLVKLANGDIRRAHYACDLSGSEQPAFQGWFVQSSHGYTECVPAPTHWMPDLP